jgi:hypothetical protein
LGIGVEKKGVGSKQKSESDPVGNTRFVHPEEKNALARGLKNQMSLAEQESLQVGIGRFI